MELDLGPQNPGDGPLIRRVRLHQSWYRAAVLGLSRWGSTRGRSAKELGSVLTDGDVAAGLNFGSPSAFRLYKTRHSEGWGIDPRCSAEPGDDHQSVRPARAGRRLAPGVP